MAIESATPAATTRATAPAFVRKSSGLVKAGTPWRIFVMVMGLQGIGAFMALFFLYGVGPFPHSNMLLAIVLVAIFLQFVNVAYALLASAYPRSGGEYVFISRILSPVLGFTLNFGAFIAFCFFCSTGAYLVCVICLAPGLQVFGVVTDNSSISSAGSWLAENNNAWLVASLMVVAYGVLVSAGMKMYYRYQQASWWIGGACFLVLFIVYAVSSKETFISGFNDYMQATGSGSTTYSDVIATAKENGLPSGHTLGDTLGIFAVATSISATCSAYIGGEVRTPIRTQLLGGVGGGVAFMLLTIAFALLVAKTTGLDFNQAATFLNIQSGDNYAPDQLPVYTFYAYLCTTSPVLLILMITGVVLLGLLLVPGQIILPTRMLFAWSFDRVIPKQVAKVDPRTGSPLVATVITVIVCEILLALYGSGQITFINPILLIGPVWFTGCLCAVLMPYMPHSRDFYKKSRINKSWLGVPVITLFGIGGVIFWIISLYMALTTDALGANAWSNVRIAIVTFAAPLVYFIGMRLYRRRQGLELDSTFAELPPD
jgi:APA family basic amino acid/polyamine antiporter